MSETLLYLGTTLVLLFGGHAAGVPYDPDRTFQFTGPCAQQEQWGMPGVAAFTSCDKLAHAAGGASVVLVSFALDRKTGRESCARTALRGALHAQVASAGFELAVALNNRARWHQAGYGIGLRDHAAVTLGSAVGGAAICATRALLQ